MGSRGSPGLRMGRAGSPGLGFLAASFAAGAVYDAALGLVILASPPAVLAFFSIPPPPDPMHFRFAALLLLVLPLFYILPAVDPARFAPVAAAGTGARTLGAAFLFAHAAAGAPAAYVGFAAVDAAFALAHAWGLRRAGLDLLGRTRRL